LSQTDKSLYDQLPRWWISRDRYGNPFVGRFKVLLVAIVLYWACTTHPLWAIIPGALLVDLAVRAQEHWFLRFIMVWLLANAMYYSLTGGWS
jgi:hypothetical protein